MTPFEIIILTIIYLVCCGYMAEMFSKEENVWLRALLVILSLVFAIYAPLMFGGMLFEKMKGE